MPVDPGICLVPSEQLLCAWKLAAKESLSQGDISAGQCNRSEVGCIPVLPLLHAQLPKARCHPAQLRRPIEEVVRSTLVFAITRFM